MAIDKYPEARNKLTFREDVEEESNEDEEDSDDARLSDEI